METTNHHQEKEYVLVQILYLYIIPTLLLYYRIIPDKFDFILLFAVALFMYGIIRKANWTYADMEIRKNFMKDLVPYLIFTVVGIIVLVLISEIVPSVEKREYYQWWENARFLLLFIPISVLQEVVFRGILMRLLLKAFTSIAFIVVLNASIFSMIHIIFLNPIVVIPLTFIAGIGFAFMYYKYPNLIMISISHTVLNFTAMILGFFVLR